LPTILLTNDDGIHSPAFRALWRALLDSKLGDVVPVVPEREVSAAGKGLTLHKPLRIGEVYARLGRGRYSKAYLTNGTPGDCVIIGMRWILEDKPDVVVSGMNMGDNITVDNLFTSGTIAGAVEGVLHGIQAVAFSVEIPTGARGLNPEAFRAHASVAARVVSWMLEEGLPRGVDMLNVNFPFRISDDTPVRLTRLGWIKFENYILERVDPRGKPYYWIGSTQLNVGEEHRGTDLYALTVERAISVTPIRLDATVPFWLSPEDFEEMAKVAWSAREKLEELVESLSSLVKEVKLR